MRFDGPERDLGGILSEAVVEQVGSGLGHELRRARMSSSESLTRLFSIFLQASSAAAGRYTVIKS